MDVREVRKLELSMLLELYTQLHDNAMPVINEHIEYIWENIINDKHHHTIVGVIEDKIISACTLIIVPNLTHDQRPYAFIENVITHELHRGKGYATAVLGYAKQIAKRGDCYKIMLMTGSKQESTLNFYRRAGYNSSDKTAFIQWL